MAANKKLTKLFTDIADSIREVDGSIGKMTASEFPANIRSLKEEKPAYDTSEGITFHDYDGTLLYSYRVEEIKGLKELPPLPHHDGLICQGWNWDYEDVIALDYPMVIGANYITDDGKTRLYLEVDKVRPSVKVEFTQTYPHGVVVNWGDGTEETFDGTSVKSSHTYQNGGSYVVTLDPNDACNISFYMMMGTSSANNAVSLNSLRKIEFGKNIIGSSSSTQQTLYSNYRLKTVTIPDYIENEFFFIFYSCSLLECLVIPKKVTSLRNNIAYNAERLTVVSLPYGLQNIGGSDFESCDLLQHMGIPDTVRSFGTRCFVGCKSLKHVHIPKQTYEIQNNAFTNSGILNIDIPATLTTLGNQNFAQTCITKVTIPNTITIFPAYTFQASSTLEELFLPDSIVEIAVQSIVSAGLTKLRLSRNLRTIQGGAISVQSLTSLVFPPTMSLIKGSAFQNMSCMKFFDFTCCNQIPTLESAGAFSGYPADFEIRVPEDLYDQWITSTNWTTYADRIVAYPRTEYESENN